MKKFNHTTATLTVPLLACIPEAALQAINFTLSLEGKFSNDPDDSGGKTNFGIADLRDGTADGLIDLDLDGIGDIPVEQLTREQAICIFHRDYWLANQCDKLPSSIAFMVFDCAVNQGGYIARKTLQQTLGVKVDGLIGPNTIAAAKASHKLYLLLDYACRRIQHYRAICLAQPSKNKFAKGWITRTFDALREAHMILAFGAEE